MGENMITERWSIRTVKMEVLDRFGKRHNGGKHPPLRRYFDVAALEVAHAVQR